MSYNGQNVEVLRNHFVVPSRISFVPSRVIAVPSRLLVVSVFDCVFGSFGRHYVTKQSGHKHKIEMARHCRDT